MGKSLPATATTLRELARLLSSSPERLQRSRPRHTKQPPVVRALSAAKTRQSGGVRVDSDPVKKTKMGHNILEGRERVPLAEVVSDCVHRWFQDTLREAKNGDRAMEVLVGQMYLSGYGVPRDEKKVHFCFTSDFLLLGFCCMDTMLLEILESLSFFLFQFYCFWSWVSSLCIDTNLSGRLWCFREVQKIKFVCCFGFRLEQIPGFSILGF